ncbi:glycosyltransferase family 2 protein [Microvirga massiliensis]|uniref:glycosyltransferase family 2 protein n=1 Tax=Microvirga massiliensis TaxID=1033741 RepID=UPI00065FE785|nr:glycosyltransferase [Microvirga massiliensis]
MIEASVIIPHYDDLQQLSLCLELLDHQTLERSRFEVIISDNGSKCGLHAVEQVAAGRARVILAHTKGAGPARNEGAKFATGKALAFIDSDCRPTPDWLRQGLIGLEEFPIVGGPVLVVPKDPDHVTPEEAFDMVFGFNALEFLQKRGFIGSGNLFVRREVFDQVGGFRSGVSEDLEWSHRAVSLGFPLNHVAGAVVSHPARRDWNELARTYDRRTQEAYLLTRERRAGKLRWIMQSWMVLASPVPHIAKVFASPRLTSWRDRWGAIRVLFRLRIFRFIHAYRVMAAVERTKPSADNPQAALPLSPVRAERSRE